MRLTNSLWTLERFVTGCCRMIGTSHFSYLEHLMLTVGMVVLGLVSFAAMLAFVKLCDHV